MANLSDKSILITGGTGTIGSSLLRAIAALPDDHQPRKVIILSRDEFKQYRLRQQFSSRQFPFLTFALADVSNYSLLSPHFRQVDVVIHAAALKRVETGENQPTAFVQTNVQGTTHVLNAALAHSVPQLITISTDKAVYPTTLYGATKLCAERLTLQSNQDGVLKASVIRLGNIFGSRGSFVPELIDYRDPSTVEITHPEMTRFTMTAAESARYILKQVATAEGSEIFVPKMKAYRLLDVVQELAPAAQINFSTPRFTEKIHETLLSQEEARFAHLRSHDFIIKIAANPLTSHQLSSETQETDFQSYTSDKAEALSRSEIAEMISTLREK
ncbi:MAG: polysaccharide biosynthesis protein [Bacteroidota bacterium]